MNSTLQQQSQHQVQSLRYVLNQVLVGKQNVVEMVLACLLARGHLLMEDLPGLGKTTLAKAIASAVSADFARIQCTPDLLPSDVTGFSMFNQKSREFEFHRGPVFSDILLADEINRTTPRTQSALFEAMAERQVTVEGQPHFLSETFFVIATQNPLESLGTFPLPEAQLDRFALKLKIGYPDPASEIDMLAAAVGQRQFESKAIAPVLNLRQLQRLQREVAAVNVCTEVQRYLVRLAEYTRRHSRIHLGISPRGLMIWQSLAQAKAFLDDRQFVSPEDVQQMAVPVLSVRLFGEFDSTEAMVADVLQSTPVPV
ncbi:MAG: MoxR family ATPase [Planctomycetales bacterium]|nr:MoxR family ATPase [Planctomycetales bacterium]